MSDLLDPLWASTLDRIDLDLPRHSVVIEAYAVDQGTTTRYRLECAGKTDFHYANDDLTGDTPGRRRNAALRRRRSE